MFTKVIPLSLLSYLSDCTVDINLSEFEYLADHLTPEECRKLVALLHYHTFDVPKQLAAAGLLNFLMLNRPNFNQF